MLQHLLRTAVPKSDVSAAESAPRVALEEVSKKHEDGMLRQPVGDELPCQQVTACEGLLMAIDDPFEEADRGFKCVQFRTPSQVASGQTKTTTGMCLLCLRKQTMLAWYNAAASRRQQTSVCQPHRVRVGVVGEYAQSACIAANDGAFEGIVAPFVKHGRHHYEYCDGRIVQTGHVNFREATLLPDPG